MDLTFQRGGIINWEQKEDWVWSREPATVVKPLKGDEDRELTRSVSCRAKMGL